MQFFSTLIFYNFFLFLICSPHFEEQCTFIVHFNHLVSFLLLSLVSLHIFMNFNLFFTIHKIVRVWLSRLFNVSFISLVFIFFVLLSWCSMQTVIFLLSSSINYCAITEIEKKLFANVLLIVRCYYLFVAISTSFICLANKFASFLLFTISTSFHQEVHCEMYTTGTIFDSQSYDKLSLMTNKFLMSANCTNLVSLDSFVCGIFSSFFISIHCFHFDAEKK